MIPMQLNESFLDLQEKWLCLDFTNTVDWHASNHPVDSIKTYSDLGSWAKEVGLISESRLQALVTAAADRPEEAQAALGKAIALREAIYRLFQAYLGANTAQEPDLELLNGALSEWAGQLYLEQQAQGFGWIWKGDARRLDGFLGAIAQSAAGLLTSPELSRVGMCADETGCGWLFFDTSRNHSRRWCDMQGCGNRAKARQHYEKKKAGKQ